MYKRSEIASLNVTSLCTLLFVFVTDIIFSILVTSLLAAFFAPAESVSAEFSSSLSNSANNETNLDNFVGLSATITFWVIFVVLAL